ncbi:MAG: TonB-dependent receptor [Verrucomicrobiia bacterium]
MDTSLRLTSQKALALNIDSSIYGTLAEIGAGQETARTFFQVGGAAGTIAKSMSAYDMTFSDSIYGPTDRYVSRVRVRRMLDHEYGLLTERLSAARGATTRFFVFANTVAARSYAGNNVCHGWLGIRFQRAPGGSEHEILLHVLLLDPSNLQQQEALGLIGVNLIHAAFHHADDPQRFMEALFDDLSPQRIETDLLLFSGADFSGYDNRLINANLVNKGYTRSIVIAPDGSVLQAAELFYKHSLLVERGHFRPVTKVNLDMLASARRCMSGSAQAGQKEVIEVMEITLKNLLDDGGLEPEDFLARIEILAALGKTVMISNYGEFYRLTSYLRQCTRERIGIVVGIPLLREIFEEKYYAHLDGGILESFGRLFKNDVRLYVYPALDEKGSRLLSLENFTVAPHLRHLLEHLRFNNCLVDLQTENPPLVGQSSRMVLELIQSQSEEWEQLVAPEVAAMIRARGLFGYKKSAEKQASGGLPGE